uniref:cAMP-dependent protein kinase inhibitor beta-like n=1 Tax=Scleropages formosus TaxID=113540 RepID=A0A8C9S9X4_SCLFO
MTDVEPVATDFASTGRTGRRNALPDILGSSAGAGASDLPQKLAELAIFSPSFNILLLWLVFLKP